MYFSVNSSLFLCFEKKFKSYNTENMHQGNWWQSFCESLVKTPAVCTEENV